MTDRVRTFLMAMKHSETSLSTRLLPALKNLDRTHTAAANYIVAFDEAW